MKSLRQLCVALVFTLSLAIPAFAGGIETGIAPPPLVTTDGEIHTTRAGEIQTTGNEPTEGDSVTAAALGLIQSLLALF